MNSRIISAFLLSYAALCGSCERRYVDPKSANPGSPPRYTEADLDRMLRTNMSRAELVKVLGKPLYKTDGANECVFYYYLFTDRIPRNAPEVSVAGVSVRLKDDKVIDWSPAYQGSGRSYSNPSSLQPTHMPREPRPQVSFWVVSDTPISGGRYFDTQQFPKLGYIAASADLVITNLKSAQWAQEVGALEDQGSGACAIELSGKDALALKRVTEKNLGKQILIMAEDIPVIAPFINEPIPAGQLTIECRDATECKRLREVFARLLRK